jgi:serine/threonine-protein kinase
MEYLEGELLSARLQKAGRLPSKTALTLGRQIASALAAAHAKRIVHRDLKPDNIHVTPEANGRDRVTIVDFGLAKVIGASRLTRAGVVFGTPHYMSPEQAMGEVTDHRADVYALGVVMYEMFTGRVPFEADSYMGVLTKHMYMAPTPPSQLPGTERLGVLEEMLMRCLQKKPEQRYQSLGELCQELDRALVVAGGPPPSAPRSRPRSLLADELELPTRAELGLDAAPGLPKPIPRWPLIVLGALFLAGIGIVFGMSGRGSVRESAPRAAEPDAQPLPSVSVTGAGALAPAPASPVPAPAASSSAQTPSQNTAQDTSETPVRAATKPKRAAQERGVAVPAPVTGSGATPRTSPAATAEKKPPRVGGSEIVDPWAK